MHRYTKYAKNVKVHNANFNVILVLTNLILFKFIRKKTTQKTRTSYSICLLVSMFIKYDGFQVTDR